MKWYNRIQRLAKWLLTGLMIRLLLVTFNHKGLSAFDQLIIEQMLYPYPNQVGETLDFLRVIMTLGLSFTCFSETILWLMDLSGGSKELIRFHSTNLMSYKLKSLLLIGKCYITEYISLWMICGLFLLIVPNITWTISSLVFLCLAWFVTDLLIFTIIQYYSSAPIWTMFLVMLHILVRYLLMTYWWLLLGIFTLFCLISYLERN